MKHPSSLTLVSSALLFLNLLSCGSSQSIQEESRLAADGSHWNLANMSHDTFQAIKAACNDPMGAQDLNLSVEECYLVMAGSTVVESSWQANKSCEAWGNGYDPCCGLTQSRRHDSYAVGLQCDSKAMHSEGYKCNVLTGLRNLGCKASDGRDCRVHSHDGSLHTGVKKHLGYNSAALNAYIRSMEAVYHRQDIRDHFGINSNSLRDWHTLFYQGRPTWPTGAHEKGSAADGWIDPYSKQWYPYCQSSSADPDHDGWGYEGRSCKAR